MAAVQKREPEILAIGDTLLFQKCLPDYSPADGWALEYILTDLAGDKKLAINSVASGACHQISQNDFAAALDAGEYVFTGFAINGAERHQIYYNTLTLTPDTVLQAAGSVKTEAQEMIEILRASLKELYKKQFSETDVQRSRFVMQSQTETLTNLKYWKAMRLNEIQVERARNGHPPGNVQEAVFCIG